MKPLPPQVVQVRVLTAPVPRQWAQATAGDWTRTLPLPPQTQQVEREDMISKGSLPRPPQKAQVSSSNTTGSRLRRARPMQTSSLTIFRLRSCGYYISCPVSPWSLLCPVFHPTSFSLCSSEMAASRRLQTAGPLPWRLRPPGL